MRYKEFVLQGALAVGSDGVVIIDSFNSHKYGHIAIWTGKNWVSDFKQNNCDIYKDGKQAWDAGKFHFYRFKNRINV